MSSTYAFINNQTASYNSIKNRINLSNEGRKRFDRLNQHLSIDEFVTPGQIVIVGSDSKFDITDSCTLDEARLMLHARTVQLALKNNPAAADTHLVENYDLLQSLLTYGSIGIGSSTSGWSHHLSQVKQTLERIEGLYQQHRSKGAVSNANDFIAKRQHLYRQLDQQLQGVAQYGTSLRKSDSIKHTLGISTKSHMHHGEIAGYAERITGISRLSNALKNGTFVGIALDFANTSLEIKEACRAGSLEQCERAQYVEAGKFVGGVAGSYAGGIIGQRILIAICEKARIRHGAALLGCAIVGGAAGGWGVGMGLAEGGSGMGEILYKEMQN